VETALGGSAVEVVLSSADSFWVIVLKQLVLSERWCSFQLLPGALIDLSCRGGLPGIVAARECKSPAHANQLRNTYESPWQLPALWS
jgi:hypothetical protein